MTSKPLHCAFRIIMSLIFFLIIISSSFKLQNLSNVFQQLRAVTTCKDISVQLFFTDELSWTSEDSSETKEELLLSHVYKYNECVHENLLMSRNECRKKKKKKKGWFDRISSKWANIYGFDHFDKFLPFLLMHAFLNIECQYRHSFWTNLVNKRLIHEIRSSNAQVQNIHFFQDCIVKSIQKPRRVRHLNVQIIHM